MSRAYSLGTKPKPSKMSQSSPIPVMLPTPPKVWPKQRPAPAPPTRTVSLPPEDTSPNWLRNRSKSLDCLDEADNDPSPQLLVTHHSKPLQQLLQDVTLPKAFRVTKGYHGHREEDSLSEQEVFTAEALLCRTVVMGTDSRGHPFTLPYNSTLHFSLLSQPTDPDTFRNVVCDKVADILELNHLPAAVRVTQDHSASSARSRLRKGDIIFPKAVSKDKGRRGKKSTSLKATTLSGEELDLPSNVCGGFQVDPLQTAIPLADLLKLGGGVFPQYVLLNLRTGQGGSDAGSRHVLKFEKREKRVSLAMRMSLPSEGSGPAHSYFEVPFDWPIEVECVKEVPPSSTKGLAPFSPRWIRRRFNPISPDDPSMCLQAALHVHVDHGCTDQGLTLHTSVKDIPSTALQNTKLASIPPLPLGEPAALPKQQKAASPKHTPLPSTLTYKPLVTPLSLGSATQLCGSSNSDHHYAEIPIRPRNSPPTPMTPTQKQSATLPRNATLPILHPDELDEDYVEMRHTCVADIVREGRKQVDPLPSPNPSIRATDPYARALVEENKRLQSLLTHFTQKVTSLEREKAELVEKVQKLEAGMSGGLASSQGGAVHMVGNSPMRVPNPEVPQQSQQQQEETRECNLSYLTNLDDDQVIDLLVAMNLQDYVEAFRREGIDGTLLVALSNEDLQQLGVTSALHLKKFNFLTDGRISAYQKLTRLAGKSA